MFKVIDTRTDDDVTIGKWKYWTVRSNGDLLLNDEIAPDYYKAICDKPKVKQLEWGEKSCGIYFSNCMKYQINGGYLWLHNSMGRSLLGGIKSINNGKQMAQEHHDTWVLSMLEGE